MKAASRFKSALAGTALALAALLPAQGSAAVLYSTPWAGTPYGWQADVFVGAYVAPAIILGGPVEISSIAWWGNYGSFGSTADDLFTVSFNGATLAGTVTPVDVGSTNAPAYKYTLLLDRALLFSGGNVEIGIVNGAGDVDLEWFWLDAGADPGSVPDGVLASSIEIDGARQSTPIPEPGTLALFAGAGGAMLALRRRRVAQAR